MPICRDWQRDHGTVRGDRARTTQPTGKATGDPYPFSTAESALPHSEVASSAAAVPVSSPRGACHAEHPRELRCPPPHACCWPCSRLTAGAVCLAAWSLTRAANRCCGASLVEASKWTGGEAGIRVGRRGGGLHRDRIYGPINPARCDLRTG
jgi:hypothetical protein